MTIGVKPRASNNHTGALTLVEVMVVLGIIVMMVVLAGVYYSKHPDPNGMLKAQRINCVNNLKEMYLAAKIWEGDNNGKFPFAVSVTNGGTMENAQEGDILGTFQIMSNQLGTPKILHCVADSSTTFAANFSTLSAKNISYFIGLNARDMNAPNWDQMHPDDFFSGDDNFQIGEIPVKPGLLVIPSHADIGWTKNRHQSNGNVTLVDGSVWQITGSRLTVSFQHNGTQMAIP